MNPLPSLPPVEESFVADTSRYVSALLEMAGAADRARDSNASLLASIEAIQRTTSEMAGRAAEAAAAERTLADAEASAAQNAAGAAAAENAAAEAAANLARSTAEAAAVAGASRDAYVGVAAAEAAAAEGAAKATETFLLLGQAQVLADAEAEKLASTARDLRTALGEDSAAAAGFTASMVAAGASAKAFNDAAADTGRAATGWRIFGVAAGQLLHWVVAAGSEFLAVTIPASIALGAAMLTAAQGAQMAQIHMQSLYTATEATANMFHTTFGQALGLRGALQQAQDAANPVVWSGLGAAVNIVRGNFQNLAGTGLDVMRIFQTFTARIVADFQQGFGAQVHGLLAGMVTDLTEFGQILGNLGHALLNFASAMPGLAEILLKIVDGVSGAVLWVSRLNPLLIGVAMGMEEFWRWGGLVVGVLTRIPTLLAGFVASGFGLVPVLGRLGEMFSALLLILPRLGVSLGIGLVTLGRWVPGLEAAGNAIGGFSAKVGAAITSMSALDLALGALVAGGMAYFIYKAATAKTGVQQMTDAMQKAVDKASGMQVFSTIAGNMGTLAAKSDALNAQVTAQASALGLTNAQWEKYAGVTGSLVHQALQQAQQGMSQQARDMINAAQAVTYLSRTYGVSFVGALELGTQAGVQFDAGIGRMSTAAEINLIKVQDLIQGYKAMGAPAGAVGTDMTAIAIQAGLQVSKVQQLTQAWQSYMGLLTGGTSALAGFEQSVTNLTTGTNKITTLLGKSGSVTLSVKSFAEDLSHFTGSGAQAWQNFNQVVGSGAESFINWMQTAGAAGVVSGGQMSGAIKGVVAQLIPFATHSEAARAELAGLAAQAGQVVPPTTKALEAFAKGGMSAQQLGKFVQDTTAKLSNMAAVAGNLGNVMQADLTAMFDKARLAASGLPGALNALSDSIQHTGLTSQSTQAALVQVIGRLSGLHQSIPTITALLNSMGYSLTQAQVKAIEAAGGLDKTASAAAQATGQMHGAVGMAQALGNALSQLHSVNLTVTTSYINEGAPGLGGTGFKNVPGHAAGGIVNAPDYGRDTYFMPVRGEEGVLTPQAVRTLGVGNLASLNTGGGSTATGPAAAGASGMPDVIYLQGQHRSTINLDGQAVADTLQPFAFRFERRNGYQWTQSGNS